MSTLEIMGIVSTIVMGIIILFFMVGFENKIGQVVHLQEEICKHTKPNSKHTSKRKSN